MNTGFITDSVKILIFAATVIITCLLVALGFRTATTAKEISNNAIIKMEELNNDLKDSDIKQFDDTTVNGCEVVNFIKKHLGDYSVTETAPLYVNVKTSISENTYINNSNLSNIRNFTNTMYIKPTAVFIGKVIKNENKIIVGVNFTQK